jgi:hypothetical protein
MKRACKILTSNNMKRVMRDNHTQEYNYDGEFHLAIKKQIIDR